MWFSDFIEFVWDKCLWGVLIISFNQISYKPNSLQKGKKIEKEIKVS